MESAHMKMNAHFFFIFPTLPLAVASSVILLHTRTTTEKTKNGTRVTKQL
jgi:hypothetical protein